MQQPAPTCEQLPDGTWKAEFAPLGASGTGATEEEAMKALLEDLKVKAGPAAQEIMPVTEQLPDGSWKAEVARLGLSATGATEEEAVLALHEAVKARGGGGRKVPTTVEELPDGRWKVEWAEAGVSYVGATEMEAKQGFRDALMAAQADPVVTAAMTNLLKPPPLEMPTEYQALPSVTAADFDEVVGDDVPVLVDFWAGWCRPCLAMAPALVDLQEEMGDRLRIVKVDVEKEAELMQRCEISAVPTLLLYRKGEQLHRIVGARGLADLRAEVAPHLA